MFGLVISDNPAVVSIEYNLVQGRFQHGILITTGTTPARARLWNNTVQQTGRSTASGNASAVFVVSAAQLELRNNLFAYTNADLLGSAFLLNDARLVGSFTADTNWYASPDPGQRRVAWNGARVTFPQWRALSHGDAASVDSAPPASMPPAGSAQPTWALQGHRARPVARPRRHTAAALRPTRHGRPAAGLNGQARAMRA